jgi:hypothetical protein
VNLIIAKKNGLEKLQRLSGPWFWEARRARKFISLAGFNLLAVVACCGKAVAGWAFGGAADVPQTSWGMVILSLSGQNLPALIPKWHAQQRLYKWHARCFL